MADYLLVTLDHGPRWDHSRGTREQAGWDEHAAFMDALVDDGTVVLGGPVGAEHDHVVLVADVPGEDEIRARLAEDPWAGDLLTIVSVKPWAVWLRADRAS